MRQIVVMPGGFHPFHAGHAALYKSAIAAFNNADTYVAATNDTKTRPFPFAIKEKLARLAGVADKHFVQVKSPFQPIEITGHYNPEEDVLIFVRSEKDRNESPKPGGTKKDGTPAYFQPWTGKDVQPFGQHAYMAYLPTVEFGPGITSATEIRNAWPTLNDKRRTAMVMSLYPVTQKNPKLAANVVKMLDMGMGNELSEGSLNEFVPPSSDGGGENDRSRRIRKLLEIAIQVAKEKNVDELGMIHAMNMIAGDDFFSVAVEGILPDITDKEYMFVLQSAYKTVKQGLAEGKITLSTDPNWYGATVDNYQATGPVVNIPAIQLVGFEPDDKMNQPKSKANVKKIVAGLKQGDKLPPLLVRKYKDGYQVLDGHHRFWAYKLLGVKSIPVQIVPDSDIEEISKQGVAEGYTDDDIETTKQFRNAIAGLKAKSVIDKAKDGVGAKYYADGTKVTPRETARRAAERKAQKDKKGVVEAEKTAKVFHPQYVDVYFLEGSRREPILVNRKVPYKLIDKYLEVVTKKYNLPQGRFEFRNAEKQVDEDWKTKLGAMALTGAMALGSSGAHSADISSPAFNGIQTISHNDGSNTTKYNSGPLSMQSTKNKQGKTTSSQRNYQIGDTNVGVGTNAVGVNTLTATGDQADNWLGVGPSTERLKVSPDKIKAFQQKVKESSFKKSNVSKNQDYLEEK